MRNHGKLLYLVMLQFWHRPFCYSISSTWWKKEKRESCNWTCQHVCTVSSCQWKLIKQIFFIFQIISVSRQDQCSKNFSSVSFQDKEYLSINCEINKDCSTEEICFVLELLTWGGKYVATLYPEEIVPENKFCSYKAINSRQMWLNS